MNQEYGYVYWFPRCDKTMLRDLAARFVGRGTAYEGTSVELRPPRPFADARDEQALALDGDFGHAYNTDVELRWRRAYPDGFDVLLLAERRAEAPPAHVMEEIVGPWRLRRSTSETSMLPIDEAKSRLPYVEYHAPNGAVQFVRVVEGTTS